MRAKGLVTVSKIVDSSGKVISLEDAIRYGWLPKPSRVPAGWGVGRDEVCLGQNLFLDQGRQLLAYCFAFRSPIENFVCSKFGVGTGTTAAAVTDVALEAPVALATGAYTGSVESIDFLSAFVVRVAFTLGLSDANGSLITEQGLFSGNNSLIARRVRTVGLNKTSDYAPTMTWRLRF
jgi:hypothetical protein